VSFQNFSLGSRTAVFRRLRSPPIVTDHLSSSKHKSADRGRRGADDVLVHGNPKRRCKVDDRG
jgi:hypothetical protein